MDLIEAFIFDMDGTIVDNMGFHSQVWVEFLAELGVSLTPTEFHRLTGGMTNRQILRQMIGDHLSDPEIAAYSEQKEVRYRSVYRNHLKPVAGFMGFLEEARRLGAPMALATSAERPNIQFILGGLGIESVFRAVVGAEEVERGKPDPEMFLKAAGRLGVDPERCLVFEDSSAGLKAAHRAGMRAVALATTTAPEVLRGLPGVVRVAEDFTTLDPRGLLGMPPA